MPFIIWMFDTSLSSGNFPTKVSHPPSRLGWVCACGWSQARGAGLITQGYLLHHHHLIAGVRHLLYGAATHKGQQGSSGASSPQTVLVLSIGLTLVLGEAVRPVQSTSHSHTLIKETTWQ